MAGLLVLVAFGVSMSWHSGRDLRESYARAGEQSALAVAKTVRRELQTKEPPSGPSLRRRLTSLQREDGNVLEIALYARDRGSFGLVASSLRSPTRRTIDPAAWRVLATGRPVFRDVDVGGRHQTVVLYPSRSADRAAPRIIEVRLDYATLDATLAHAERKSRRFTVLAVLVMLALMSLVLGRTIFAPLTRIRAVTRRVAAGQLDARVKYDRRGELGELGRDFDTMAARVQESHARLEVLARKDPLTELANHREFRERLTAELKQARLESRSLSLVAVDIDHFKAINDRYGHPAGDQVLRAVAERLSSVVRAGDFAARVGGEEFALVLPGADGELAAAVAERARAAVKELRAGETTITCSAGVASYPADAWTSAALVELADAALYAAKRDGRDRTRRYDVDSAHAGPSAGLRCEITEFLKEPGAITPVFQPIVFMATGEVYGYEALARFHGPRQLPPDAWFAHAHRCGLGPALEARAIEAALSHGGRSSEAKLFVNVSPSALVSDDVWAVLPEDMAHLTVEITEHEIATDRPEFLFALERIRRRGGQIAVDDAGGGYAGLQHLMRIRPDIIKLDRSLIDGIASDPVKAALIDSFGTFARRTGATVCAEGIENLDDLRTLGQLGVTYAQGYVLARPGPDWEQISTAAAAVCRASAMDTTLFLAEPDHESVS